MCRVLLTVDLGFTALKCDDSDDRLDRGLLTAGPGAQRSRTPVFEVMSWGRTAEGWLGAY